MKKKVIIGSIVAIAAVIGLCAWAAAMYGSAKTKANIAAYEALLDTIYGSAQDRHRGDKLLHHRIQQVIKICMESKGLGYIPPTFAGSSAGVVSPGDLDVATPLSNSFGMAERYRAHAQGVEADRNSGGNKPGIEAQRSPETAAAYNAAGDECMSKAIPLEEAYHPPGQQEVDRRLLAELRRVQTSQSAKPLLAGYRQCLHTAGYKADSRLALYEQVLRKFPSPEQPWSEMGRTSQWRKAVVQEQKAAAADTKCRTKLYRWAAGQIRPVAERLTDDQHVTALQRGWDNIAADYKAAGL